MSLPEKKVKQLIELMNQMSTTKIPAHKKIIECFDLAMDEKTLDYLIKVGTEPHVIPQLQAIFFDMYGGGVPEWEKFWEGILEMSFLHPKNTAERQYYILAPVFTGWI